MNNGNTRQKAYTICRSNFLQLFQMVCTLRIKAGLEKNHLKTWILSKIGIKELFSECMSF